MDLICFRVFCFKAFFIVLLKKFLLAFNKKKVEVKKLSIFIKLNYCCIEVYSVFPRISLIEKPVTRLLMYIMIYSIPFLLLD